jgi:hypothetical protein
MKVKKKKKTNINRRKQCFLRANIPHATFTVASHVRSSRRTAEPSSSSTGCDQGSACNIYQSPNASSFTSATFLISPTLACIYVPCCPPSALYVRSHLDATTAALIQQQITSGLLLQEKHTYMRDETNEHTAGGNRQMRRNNTESI